MLFSGIMFVVFLLFLSLDATNVCRNRLKQGCDEVTDFLNENWFIATAIRLLPINSAEKLDILRIIVDFSTFEANLAIVKWTK